MLKGIPKILSPQLLKTICEMGHGDRIVLADGNFPAESVGRNAVVLRFDGNGVLELLDAVLKLFPLDASVDSPVKLMEVAKNDPVKTPIWNDYFETLRKYDERGRDAVETIERYKFYEEAKSAYAVVATGEPALYANIILQKGVVK
jgi:L-fucose mutarotase